MEPWNEEISLGRCRPGLAALSKRTLVDLRRSRYSKLVLYSSPSVRRCSGASGTKALYSALEDI